MKMDKDLKMFTDLYIEKFESIPTFPFGSDYSAKERAEMLKQCIITNEPLTFSDSDNEGIIGD